MIKDELEDFKKIEKQKNFHFVELDITQLTLNQVFEFLCDSLHFSITNAVNKVQRFKKPKSSFHESTINPLDEAIAVQHPKTPKLQNSSTAEDIDELFSFAEEMFEKVDFLASDLKDTDLEQVLVFCRMAKFCLGKTHGNPLFLRHFLPFCFDREIFSYKNDQWSFDDKYCEAEWEIEKAKNSDNIAVPFTLKNYPERTKSILFLMSLLGENLVVDKFLAFLNHLQDPTTESINIFSENASLYEKEKEKDENPTTLGHSEIGTKPKVERRLSFVELGSIESEKTELEVEGETIYSQEELKQPQNSYTVENLAMDLSPAIDRGLVSIVHDHVRFSHESMREFSIKLFPRDVRCKAHFLIAVAMVKLWGKKEICNNIKLLSDLVFHFSIGISAISSKAGQQSESNNNPEVQYLFEQFFKYTNIDSFKTLKTMEEIIGYNLACCRKAKELSSYESSTFFLRNAVECLIALSKSTPTSLQIPDLIAEKIELYKITCFSRRDFDAQRISLLNFLRDFPENGIALCFQKNYSLSLAVFNLAAEIEMLLSNSLNSIHVIKNIVFKNCTSEYDKINCLKILLNFESSRSRYVECVVLAREYILGLFEMEKIANDYMLTGSKEEIEKEKTKFTNLIKQVTKSDHFRTFDGVFEHLRRLGPDNMFVTAIIEVFSAIIPATYLLSFSLMESLAYKTCGLCIEFGISEGAASCFGYLAMVYMRRKEGILADSCCKVFFSSFHFFCDLFAPTPFFFGKNSWA